MKETIEITESNYKGYCSIDIVAFSFAQPGAMGVPGGVEIIDSDGWLYQTNWCDGDLSLDHLLEVVPVLKDCKIGVSGHRAPEGWAPVYLGAGNHLTVRADYYGRFEEEVNKRRIKTPADMYVQWLEIMLQLFDKGEGN
jgi:hypothetical protein